MAELQNDVTGLNSSLVEVINDGAKNLLHFDGLSSATSNGVSFTLNGDYSVTATRVSSSSSTASVDLTLNGNYVYLDDWCDGKHYISGCPANGSSTTYEVLAQTYGATDYIKRDYGDGILLDAKSVSNTNIVFRLIVRSGFTGTIIFKPMVTTKAQFNTSPTYEPYALGNQVLTPALIEQVDSGAKNKIIVGSLTTQTINGITFTPQNDGTVKVTGSIIDSTAENSVYNYGTVTAASGDIISEGLSAVDAKAYVYLRAGSTSLNYETHKTVVTSDIGVSRTVAIAVVASYSGTINYTFKPMICTAADWNVSHNYVPYRPNWDLVGKLAIPIIIEKQVSIANSLIDTGVTYTLPANNYYRVTAYQKYNNNAPATIAIVNNQNADPLVDTGVYAITETPYPENSYMRALSASTIVKTGSTAETLYVFAKARGSTAKNNIIALVIEPLN